MRIARSREGSASTEGENGVLVQNWAHVVRAARRTWLILLAVSGVALLAPSAAPPPASEVAAAGVVPSGFVETTAISGLTNPMVVRFASDGRIFVAEKSGLIKVFDNLSDATPTTFADLRTNVYNFWDRGLLGMALHPQFPAVPYIYVSYAYDHILGDPAPPPRWGTPGATSDACPSPPGPLSDGCVVSARVSRLQAAGSVMTGAEQVLVEGWCQQYPSHSIGAVEFGPDGMLYVSGGDGASWTFVDYGQEGDPVNPCGDPGGSAPTPPTAEGGALRSQDLRTSGDAVGLNGTILRLHPSTGAAAPGNPLSGHPDANARRTIAYGLRNPFRFAFRPGTNELWLGDVGWNDWEEINRITNPTGSVLNFGWPCYEGQSRQSGYDAADLAICENLYGEPSADTKPYFAYHHNDKVVPGESCSTGTSSVSGLAFEFAPTSGTFPADYAGALFWADYSRRCIWAMQRNGNQPPSPGSIRTFVADASGPVNLEFGPDGSLYYADFDGGTIRRVSYGEPPAGGPTYNPPVHYGTGTNAHGLAIAHLNGDGRLDLAVANAGSNNVSVLLGSADGSFAPATNFAVGSQPKSVTTSDFNGDGNVDLVTANQNSNTVSVLLGNGAGSFAAAVHYPVCTGAHEVAVGQFNGDTNPDLAVACWGGTVISVLLGAASGTFGAATSYAAGSAPHSLVARDFNGDGRHDLAIANRTSDNVSVLFGNGSGTFGGPTNYVVGTGPHSIRAGDFNGDGVADLVTANDTSNNVTILRGAPNGTFGSIASYPTGSVPKGVALGDFNADGKLDVVTANTAGRYPSGNNNPGGDQVSILLGTGTGSVGSAASYQVGNTPFAVGVARLDGDGRPDLVTANWFGNNASVVLSSGTAPPPPPPGTQYLSDVSWTSATNGWGPVERNMSNGEAAAGDGRTITLNGVTHAKGLGVHAPSDVRYTIAGCTRFKADVGVDDEVGSLGSVVFQVFSGAVKIYDSGAMTGASATAQVDIPITGVTDLRLVVTGTGDGIDYDHADWAQARIECGSASDTTPPTITARTPAPGASGVAVGVSPTATFSEAMNASTITSSTFTLVQQGQSTPLPATVTYSAGSLTATLDPSANLAAGTTYTATVKGGSSGVKDVAGNPLASDASWSFTTASGQGTTTTYLSDLTWTQATNGWGPVEKDRSNGEAGAGDGATLTLNGTTYAKGLGVHAVSDVRYAISGCSRFKASVGVDDEVGSLGSVVFEVYAGASKVFDSGTMTGSSATQAVDVSIAGASELRLVVTAGAGGLDYDHADWADARIECGG
jgi:glucose/arabinose dehydrogenase